MVERRRRGMVRAVALSSVIVAAALAGCGERTVGHDPRLVQQLDPVLHRLDDTGAIVAARVVELPEGRELYACNIDEPVMPASNMKLVTSSVALEMLGPDYIFRTHLAHDGENLWLIGTGDPAVGDPAIARQNGESVESVLDRWADDLLAKGIAHVPGKLMYFDGAFENLQIAPSWPHDDLVHWYAAPVSGLNFNDNCVDITVSPAGKNQPAEYEVVPAVTDLVVVNECVSGREEAPSISRMPYANVFVLGGGCAKRKALKSKPVIDPGAFFADALRTHLATRGITIDGPTESSPRPLDGRMPPNPARVIAIHETPMSDVMWRTNKSSQNLFAECLRKLVGQVYDAQHGLDRPGSWESGRRATHAFLRRHGIDDTGLVTVDGSGLSREDRVTARLITDLLRFMANHENAEAFRASLAEPGQTGTLRSRMKDLSGHVFAKTGYIRGVRALSGYVHTRSDRWLCFSFIYNDIGGSVKPFEALQDEAVHVLCDWPELAEPAPVATSAPSRGAHD